MKLNLQKSTAEDSLIEGCRRNNAKSQKALYQKYSDSMLGVVCRYIKDRSEAEEVMIASIMKVFEHIDMYKGEGSFEGWIRRITVNESLMYLRKNKNMYLEVDIEYADQQPDYEMAEQNLAIEDLMSLVQALPVGYRTVFNMYAIEGYSHSEIAETLSINVNTSKSQLSRARVTLQKAIVELEQNVKKKHLGNE